MYFQNNFREKDKFKYFDCEKTDKQLVQLYYKIAKEWEINEDWKLVTWTIRDDNGNIIYDSFKIWKQNIDNKYKQERLI